MSTIEQIQDWMNYALEQEELMIASLGTGDTNMAKRAEREMEWALEEAIKLEKQ